ncbi:MULTISPECIES: SEC-C metal-binding domain-containing protein [unclassified Oceanobacillus]|uniref:SEC-C metal-binding domain-containing protein n=1 Tax=unclassified Oceanobacillus TaxID=2630292 RepID=UPI00300E2B6B
MDDREVFEEFDEKAFSDDLQSTLEAFSRYLSEVQGLKADIVDQHIERIFFYGGSYVEYIGGTIREFDADHIIEFLGDYYIRKVFDSTKSDIGPYLTTFKRFAKFLYDNGDLREEDLTEINMVCKQKEYFHHRFETYFSSNDLEAWYFDNDLDHYLEEMERAYQLEESDALDVDPNFVRLLNERNVKAPIAVNAFTSFLEKIQQEKYVKLTSGRQNITRKFWQELDHALDLGLFTKPTLNQEDIGLFHFFYVAGNHLRLYRIKGNRLQPTEFLNAYQKLTDEEKFVLLMDVLWNQLSWRKVQPSNRGGRVELTQAKRANIAEVLSQFPVDKEIKLREDRLGVMLVNQTFQGITDHVFKYIMPIMEYFGLFQLKLRYTGDNEQYYMGIDSIRINSFGLFVFNQLKKMGNQLPEQIPTDPMTELFMQMTERSTPIIKENKVGRNDPCPCGNGKKYKRCCM